MSQVLDFTGVVRPEKPRLRVVLRGGERDDFLPDVSRRISLEEEAAADPANAPGRVLSEVFALFAVVGAFILAVTLLVPGP